MTKHTIERLPELPIEAADSLFDIHESADTIQVCSAALVSLYGVTKPEAMLPRLFTGDPRDSVLSKFGQQVVIAAEKEMIGAAGDDFPDNVYTYVAQKRPLPDVDPQVLASKVHSLFGKPSTTKLKYDGMPFLDAISVEGKDILFVLKGFEVRDQKDIDVVASVISRLVEIRLKHANLSCEFEQGLMLAELRPVKHMGIEDFDDMVAATNLNEEAVRRASGIDSATGLLNRNGMYQKLHDLYRLMDAEDSKHVMTIFTDGDGFKHINDTYGHSQGDRVILTLSKKASAFEAALRTAFPECSKDITVVVGRYGGDEFVITVAGIDFSSDPMAAELVQEFTKRYFKNEPMPEYGIHAVRTWIKDEANRQTVYLDTSSTIGVCLQTHAQAILAGHERNIHDADVLMNGEKAFSQRRRVGDQALRSVASYPDSPFFDQGVDDAEL